jgi:hypothetical protein
MNQTPSIDFSTYSDEQLESALLTINRYKFEQNYLACCSEIEKRKAEGLWQINSAKKKQKSILQIRKWVRVAALAQAIGGVYGIGTYLYTYGPRLVGGKIPTITSILVFISIAMFAATVWAAWKYWKTEQDKNGLWRLSLVLQIPVFNLSGFLYEFYSGFTAPLGEAGKNIAIKANLGSSLVLAWDPQNTTPFLMVNLAAIALLVLLSQIKSEI